MSHIVFFLEEPSAKELIEAILPRIFDPVPEKQFVVFEGKNDLRKQIGKKIQGYLVPNALFIILVDQDASDCQQVKKDIQQLCALANRDILVRIACRELESWYLADLRAAEKGLGIPGIAKQQNKKKYRDPDSQRNPAQLLEKLCNKYQKISGSRSIGPYLDLGDTRSTSFANFIKGLRRIGGQLSPRQ